MFYEPIKWVSVYVELPGVYQDMKAHGYLNSVNWEQLGGKEMTVDQLTSCSPVIKNGDLYLSQLQSAIARGAFLDPLFPAVPCGFIAKNIYNDTVTISHASNDNNQSGTDWWPLEL